MVGQPNEQPTRTNQGTKPNPTDTRQTGTDRTNTTKTNHKPTKGRRNRDNEEPNQGNQERHGGELILRFLESGGGSQERPRHGSGRPGTPENRSGVFAVEDHAQILGELTQ